MLGPSMGQPMPRIRSRIILYSLLTNLKPSAQIVHINTAFFLLKYLPTFSLLYLEPELDARILNFSSKHIYGIVTLVV